MVGLTERLLNEGMQKGIQKGLQKGRQEGRQEGEMSVLIRQLTRRFGPLDRLLGITEMGTFLISSASADLSGETAEMRNVPIS